MVLMQGEGGLELGQEMPSFNLKNIDGKLVSSNDLTKDLKMIVFTCNHCPYAIKEWPRLIETYSKHKNKMDIVAINPNDAIKYPDDSYDKMIEFAKDNGVEFPYLHDGTQEIAKKFGAKCTPDIYIFKDNKLVHRGIIEGALDEIVSKGKVESEVCSSEGCSIKWKE